MVTIEIKYANGKTEIKQLGEGSYTIGRESGDIVLGDAEVSGRHAELSIRGDKITFTDQGSTNGSFSSDGRRLSVPTLMALGHPIKMSKCSITVKALSKPAMKTAVSPAAAASAVESVGEAVIDAADSASKAGAEAASKVAGAVAGSDADEAAKQFNKGVADFDKIDIEAAVKLPMEDNDWLMKCLIMGLISLVPVAGGLNLMGWIVACYNMRREGQTTLPPSGLNYIGDGFKLFLTWLPVVGVVVAIYILFFIISLIIPFFFLLAPLLVALIGLIYLALGPAVLYLHIVENESFASIKFPQIFEVIKTDSSKYVSFWLMMLVAGLISGLGSIALGIGVILTMPYATVLQGIAVADYRTTREK